MKPHDLLEDKAGCVRAEALNRAEDDAMAESDLQLELQSIGVGTMRTSATYAAFLIQLEGNRQKQIDVLDSVMEALRISPEEILLHRQRPDVVDEEARRRWEFDRDDLEQSQRKRSSR